MADLLVAAKATMLEVLRAKLGQRPILGNWQTLGDYLRLVMGSDVEECLRVLFLSGRSELLADEVMFEGGLRSITIEPRRIFSRAFDLGSQRLILVHNHPSGDPTPTETDCSVTASLRDLGCGLGVSIADHLVVSADGITSMRAAGYL